MCVHVCADLNYKAEGNRSACRGCTPWGVDEVSSWGLALRTTLAGPKGPLSSFGSVRLPAVSLGDSSETRVRRPIWTKLSELLWGLRPQHLSVPSPPGQKAEWWPGHGLEGDWAEGQGGRPPGDPPARPPGNSGLRGLQLGPRTGGWRPGSLSKSIRALSSDLQMSSCPSESDLDPEGGGHDSISSSAYSSRKDPLLYMQPG